MSEIGSSVVDFRFGDRLEESTSKHAKGMGRYLIAKLGKSSQSLSSSYAVFQKLPSWIVVSRRAFRIFPYCVDRQGGGCPVLTPA